MTGRGLVLTLGLFYLAACQEDPEPRLTDVKVDLAPCLGDLEGRLLDAEGEPMGPSCRPTLLERVGSGRANACFVLREAEKKDAKPAYITLKLDAEGLKPVGDSVVEIEPGLKVEASLFVFGDGFDEKQCAKGGLAVDAPCDGPCLIKLNQVATAVAKVTAKDKERADGARISSTVFDFKSQNACSVTAGSNMPAAEVCDGADNDCNGVIDDDVPGTGEDCEVGVGACLRRGKIRCLGQSGELACDATAGDPAAETCNGVDDDCDGEVDEQEGGGPLVRSCYTGNPEELRPDSPATVCAQGTETCGGGAWGICTGQVLPSGETCDERDNDCDGEVDEDDGQLQDDRANCGFCGNVCGAGMICQAGTCSSTCMEGTTDCGGFCKDLRRDVDNCGRCGNQCAPGEVCSESTCRPTCAVGLTFCDVCRDLLTDTLHCGFCDNPCLAEQTCEGGECVCPAAPNGNPQQVCAGACVDTLTDTTNCGGCSDQDGEICLEGQVCRNGACQCPNPATQVVCDGMCVNYLTDRTYCGGCLDDNPGNGVDDPSRDGRTCLDGQVCNQGVCDFSCPAGQIVCGDGECIDPQSNTTHCGGCNDQDGATCRNSEVCVGGGCVCPLTPGNTPQEFCAGACVDLLSNTAHCGACDRDCLPGQVCRNGNCECPSPATQDVCDGMCVNILTDREYCGGCTNRNGNPADDENMAGQVCPPGQVCFGLDGVGTCDFSCPEGQDICDGGCVNLQNNTDHCGDCGNHCLQSELCEGGTCVCPPAANGNPQEVCLDVCTDVLTSTVHCGECGIRCLEGQVCRNGRCECPTPATQDVCDGMCVNVLTDREYCGGCTNRNGNPGDDENNAGQVCPAGQVCSGGNCDFSCPAGQDECGGGCVDLQTSLIHCGRCGISCLAGQVCRRGVCECPDPANELVCQGRCIDPDTDPFYCGCEGGADTGDLCTGGRICNNGSCACPNANQRFCGGACVNVQTDRTHCGGCAGQGGVTCGAGQVCSNGACIISCPQGQIACGQQCINPLTDNAHCGGCAGQGGMACAAGQVCSNGVCAANCGPGLTVCGGVCTNINFDPANCGNCGTVCPDRANSEPFCANRTCGITCDANFGNCDNRNDNGCESDLRTVDNCGICGAVCAEGGASPICRSVNNVLACRTCTHDSQCNSRPGNLNQCDEGTGRCVECTVDGHCGAGRFCVDNACASCRPDGTGCTESSNLSVCGGDGTCRGCANDAECLNRLGNLNQCDEGTGRCVQCTDDGQCGAGQYCVNNACVSCRSDGTGCTESGASPICAANGTCTTCSNDAQCANRLGSLDQCNEGTGRCVQCTANAHCPVGQLCDANVCVGCRNNNSEGCVESSNMPICQSGNCRECRSDQECNNRLGSLDRCDVPTGRCVRCTADGHCGGGTPFCVANACVACRPDGTGCNESGASPICGANGVCRTCANDTECANRVGSLDQCNEGAGRCVECTADGECGAGRYCVSNVCADCRPDGTGCDESGAAPICANGACRGCDADAECNARLGDLDQCDEDSDRCVECTADPHCAEGETCTDFACVPGGG